MMGTEKQDQRELKKQVKQTKKPNYYSIFTDHNEKKNSRLRKYYIYIEKMSFKSSLNNWNGEIFKYVMREYFPEIRLTCRVKGYIHRPGKHGYRMINIETDHQRCRSSIHKTKKYLNGPHIRKIVTNGVKIQASLRDFCLVFFSDERDWQMPSTF